MDFGCESVTESGLETDITKPKKYPWKGLLAQSRSHLESLMYLHVYKLISLTDSTSSQQWQCLRKNQHTEIRG